MDKEINKNSNSLLYDFERGQLGFYCEGCKQVHAININDINNTKRPVWDWNKSYEKPTFHPSILVTKPGVNYRCHSFVTDGKIQYLNDCTHELRGQTIELKKISEWENW